MSNFSMLKYSSVVTLQNLFGVRPLCSKISYYQQGKRLRSKIENNLQQNIDNKFNNEINHS